MITLSREIRLIVFYMTARSIYIMSIYIMSYRCFLIYLLLTSQVVCRMIADISAKLFPVIGLNSS